MPIHTLTLTRRTAVASALIAVAVVLSIWLGVGNSQATLAPAAAVPSDTHSNSIYWGAYVGPQLTGESVPWDMGALRDFEDHDAGRKGMSIVPFYLAFNNCPGSGCTPYTFPVTQFNQIRSEGSIPMLSWGSYSLADSTKNATPANAADPRFSLAGIIAGDYDSYLRNFAEAAKAWNHPFFLRFDWEMNGNWYPWSEQAGANRAGQFVEAWRHVYDIFQRVGATKVSWTWCPDASVLTNLKELYPGNAYVNWTCADVYNFGASTTNGTGSWKSWSEAMAPAYDLITSTIAPSKPFMIGEYGSTSLGGSQASWLGTALKQTPIDFPKVHAMVLFDADPAGLQLAIDNSSSSIKAFSVGIHSPIYANNHFSNLTAITPQPSGG